MDFHLAKHNMLWLTFLITTILESIQCSPNILYKIDWVIIDCIIILYAYSGNL